jgi:hypothetical protein
MNDIKKIRIGTLKVLSPREETQHYECALWHKTVECPPGEYPVYAYLCPHHAKDGELGHTLYIPFTGVVKSACFTNRIGAYYGSDSRPKEVGTIQESNLKISAISMHELVQSGELILDNDLLNQDS